MSSDRQRSADLARLVGVIEPIAKPITSATESLKFQNKLVGMPVHGSMAVKSSTIKG